MRIGRIRQEYGLEVPAPRLVCRHVRNGPFEIVPPQSEHRNADRIGDRIRRTGAFVAGMGMQWLLRT